MEIIAENRRARHDYHIEDTYTAGLMLEGWEVKSILNGRANFGGGGAFVTFKNGEAFLEGAQITPMPNAAQNLVDRCEPYRTRKLLLNRSEITKLGRRVAERGYTLVPLALVRPEVGSGKLKLTIGVAKGKKQYDKRAAAKARDIERAEGL